MNTHTGNTQPAIDQEEHSRIGGLDGKKVFVMDASGNQITSFGGSLSGNVTINPGPNFIGLATVNIGSSNATLFAVVNTSAAGQASVVLDASLSKIGFATVAVASAATIFAVVNTSAAGQSSVVLDNSLANIGFATVNQVNQPALVAGAAFIGLVSVSGFANPLPVTFSGNVTLSDAKTSIGLVTLNPSSAYIGLVTNTQVGLTTLAPSPNYIGLVTTTIGSSPSVQAFGQYMPTMPSIASGGLGPISLDVNGRQIVSLFTIADPKGFIGNVTVTGNIGITGNVTLSDAKTFIGLTTTTLGASPAYIGLASVNIGGTLPALAAGAAFVGLATVNIGSSNTVVLGAGAALVGIVTIANSNIRSLTGNITLSDAKTFIGLTTTTLGASPAFIGIVTITNQPALVAGAAYIGLATVNIGSGNTVTLGAGAALAGIVTVANPSSFTGNVTLDDGSLTGLVAGVAGIGFATVAIQTGVSNIGFATITAGAGVAFIGHATVRIASNVNTNIGLVTVDGGTVKSLVSLGASVQNIGFATIFQAFPGGATVYSGIISATGNTTVFVAPGSNLFFLKDLHISSLGRAEVEIRSGATTIIPFTSLSTTSGFYEYYGEYGKPGRAQADALVIGLNGGATISYAATVRFGV